jgi:hypothetical protein
MHVSINKPCKVKGMLLFSHDFLNIIKIKTTSQVGQRFWQKKKGLRINILKTSLCDQTILYTNATTVVKYEFLFQLLCDKTYLSHRIYAMETAVWLDFHNKSIQQLSSSHIPNC